MPFWKMIKEGYDHFEVTRQEPKVDFCEKKYGVRCAKAPDAKRDLVFDAAAKCPAYVIPDEVADAVRERQQDEQARNRQADRQRHAGRPDQHRIDGRRTRCCRQPAEGSTDVGGADGQGLSAARAFPRSRTIPSTVNPPRGPVTSPEEPLAASMRRLNTPAATRVASRRPTARPMDSSLASPQGGPRRCGDTTATAQPARPSRSRRGQAERSSTRRKPHAEGRAPKAPDNTKQAAPARR